MSARGFSHHSQGRHRSRLETAFGLEVGGGQPTGKNKIMYPVLFPPMREATFSHSQLKKYIWPFKKKQNKWNVFCQINTATSVHLCFLPIFDSKKGYIWNINQIFANENFYHISIGIQKTDIGETTVEKTQVCMYLLLAHSRGQAHTQCQCVWPRSVWSVDSPRGQRSGGDWWLSLIALFRLVSKCI